MTDIYETTLQADPDAYTIGVIDYLDPTHRQVSHAETLEIACSHVLTLLTWFTPQQIVVLDPYGKRLAIDCFSTPEEWATGLNEGMSCSDFVTFR